MARINRSIFLDHKSGILQERANANMSTEYTLAIKTCTSVPISTMSAKEVKQQIVTSSQTMENMQGCCVSDRKEQLDIILHAISLASKLAAIDVESPSTEQSDSASSRLISTRIKEQMTIQAEIDRLQQQWKLEDTALPSLIASIHRLQSHIGHLQNESDSLTSRFRSTEELMHEAQTQNSKLRKACLKVFRQNKKLKLKLQSKKKETRNFVSAVREFLTKKKQEEIDTEEFLVACHESMLKKSCEMNNSASAVAVLDSADTPAEVGNRARTFTAESTFSEYSFGSIFEDIGADTNVESDSNSKILEIDTVDTVNSNLIGYDCDTSVHSYISSSSKSFFTDESISTIRFKDTDVLGCSYDTMMGDTGNSDECKDQDDAIERHNNRASYMVQSPSYSLSFPSAKDIGMQFVEVKTSILNHSKSSTSLIGGNRRRSFSDGAVLDLTVVGKVKECKKRQNVLSPSCSSRSCDKICEENVSDEPLSSQIVKLQPLSPRKSSFSMDKMFGNYSKKNNLNEKDSKSSQPGSVAQNMILVRELEGFDTAINVRPTIGARLIAIDDQSLLSGHWTLGKAMEYLQGQRKKNESIKLMFRNEPLNKTQKKSLDQFDASNHNAATAKTVARGSQSKSPTNLLPSFRIPRTKAAEESKGEKKSFSSFFKFSSKSETNEEGSMNDKPHSESLFGFMSKTSGQKEETEQSSKSDSVDPIAESPISAQHVGSATYAILDASKGPSPPYIQLDSTAKDDPSKRSNDKEVSKPNQNGDEAVSQSASTFGEAGTSAQNERVLDEEEGKAPNDDAFSLKVLSLF